MIPHIEIEKKYQLLNNNIDGLIKHFHYVREERVIDEYFDTKNGDYYQKDIFIRIRNKKTLDVKFNPDHLDKKEVKEYDASCHEYSSQEPFKETEQRKIEVLRDLISIQQPSGDTFESFMNCNDLFPLLVIDKVRKTYENTSYTCDLDDIKNLGLFLEIEYSGNQDKNLIQILSEIDAFMKDIPAKPLFTGSCEMILRKENFSLYKKGKYLLEEDIEKSAA